MRESCDVQGGNQCTPRAVRGVQDGEKYQETQKKKSGIQKIDSTLQKTEGGCLRKLNLDSLKDRSLGG